jgi:SAM-dependent methyltransferase
VAANALGYRAEGLDWSQPTVEGLRRRFPSIRWHVGDARNLAFPGGAFDAVYSPGVCEHFEEGPTEVLAETHRVLVPGGIAVVSTPCFNTWLRRHAPACAAPTEPAGLPFYQYAFTPDGMRRLLVQLGFAVLHVQPYGALDTLMRFGGWRVPGALARSVAFSLDRLPVIRQWGSCCIWVARRR